MADLDAAWTRLEAAAKAAGAKRIVEFFAAEPGRRDALTLDVDRVPLAEAVRGPSPASGPDDDVRSAVLLMQDHGWQPLVVADRNFVYGVVTAGALLSKLVMADWMPPAPSAAHCSRNW